MKVTVQKDDGASKNYAGQIFIDELICQGAILSVKDAGWMIVETTNVHTEDGIEKRQWVKLKLWLGASYVYKAEFTVYDIKGFDIALGTWWMGDMNCWYQIDHDSNEMWIADTVWAQREEGRVQYVPSLCPLDVDEGVVEQAKSMGIHTIRNGKLKNSSGCLLKWAFLIKVHHHSDGNTHLTDELPGECQETLTTFQGLSSETTYPNLQKGRQAGLEIEADRNDIIP